MNRMSSTILNTITITHVVFFHTNCLFFFSPSLPAVNNSFQPQEIRCDLEERLMPLFFKTLSMLFG